jgi:hypothetical protein
MALQILRTGVEAARAVLRPGGWCVSAVGISHVPANGLRMQVGTPVVDGAGYRLAEEGAECLAQHVRLLEPMPVTALIQEAEAGLR